MIPKMKHKEEALSSGEETREKEIRLSSGN
jgi:hypothetical protein